LSFFLNGYAQVHFLLQISSPWSLISMPSSSSIRRGLRETFDFSVFTLASGKSKIVMFSSKFGVE